jgi:hypothetical protein
VYNAQSPDLIVNIDTKDARVKANRYLFTVIFKLIGFIDFGKLKNQLEKVG